MRALPSPLAHLLPYSKVALSNYKRGLKRAAALRMLCRGALRERGGARASFGVQVPVRILAWRAAGGEVGKLP